MRNSRLYPETKFYDREESYDRVSIESEKKEKILGYTDA